MNKVIVSVLLVVVLVVAGCGEDPIERVKSGTLPVDDTVTVGSALDNYKYFGAKKWKIFKDKQNREIVQFRGFMDLDKYAGSYYMGHNLSAEEIKKAKAKLGNTSVSYVAQFAISKADDGLRVIYSAIIFDGGRIEADSGMARSHNDKDLRTLKEIYKNKPEGSTFELLWLKTRT